MKRTIATILLLCCFGGLVRAQTLPFRNYSIESGLSEAVVRDIVQDDSGYLWIGTSYGLNRFDGVNFKNFYSKDGLPNNKIYSLLEDNSSRLWIGTVSGVSVMKEDSIYTPAKLKPLNGMTVQTIFQDDRQEIWFATEGHGAWHLDNNNNLTHYGKLHGMASNKVRAIAEDKKGVLWFGTNKGLTRLKNGSFRTFTVADGLRDNKISDLLSPSDGSLWIATNDGLCRNKNSSIQCYTKEDGLPNNHIQSISEGINGSLWIGTEGGASHYNGQKFINYSVKQGLASNVIYSTYYDREGNIWFGTFGGGVSLFMGDYLKNYTKKQGLPNNLVTSIAEDHQGRPWIGTYGGGIARLSKGGTKIYNSSNGLVDNNVFTIEAGSGERMLIGTRNGFSLFDGNMFLNFDEQKIPHLKIRAVLKSKKDGSIWLGTYGDGLLRFKDGEFHHYTQEDGLANNTILALEQTSDGAVWIANYGGLSKFENQQFTNYTIADGLPNNGLLDLLVDQSGTLWLSTFGGIARFKNGKFDVITADDGLPDNVCYFINQDNQGFYWIGTSKGVARLNYNRYKKGDSDSSKTAFTLINKSQGLVANEMNAGASYKDKNGDLWMGSVGGLSKIHPERVEKSAATPKTQIESVEVSGEHVSIEPNLEIGSDNQNITIHFIGIRLAAPNQVRYEYRLKNSGEDWQQTSQRSVRYSALTGGDYTFQVKARNSDGVWSRETAEISFSVEAAFWMQWWFWATIAAGMVLIIYFIYRFYRVQKMVEIERMRVQIASDLHDDVGSALTEIALQSDFLQTMEVSETLQDSLQQIGAQSRKIVGSLDDIVWSIDARNDTIGDLTDRMQDHVNNVLPQRTISYDFQVDMGEKLDINMKENLYLIFKEAINNIAKHSNAQHVEVMLQTAGNDFELRIKDNGNSSKANRKSGQGMRNMNMRAKRLDANLTFNNDEGFEVIVNSNAE